LWGMLCAYALAFRIDRRRCSLASAEATEA
jgi:hypothetical protein